MHLVFVGAANEGDRASHLRHLIALREAAQLTVVEHHLAAGPHAHFSNTICHVHLKPGAHADEAELRHHVAQKLAAFKVPVEVIFWPETLPRNANGKIVKAELRKRFAPRA